MFCGYALSIFNIFNISPVGSIFSKRSTQKGEGSHSGIPLSLFLFLSFLLSFFSLSLSLFFCLCLCMSLSVSVSFSLPFPLSFLGISFSLSLSLSPFLFFLYGTMRQRNKLFSSSCAEDNVHHFCPISASPTKTGHKIGHFFQKRLRSTKIVV